MPQESHVLVSDLKGVDLSYWVARANMRGSSQERNVLYGHYTGGTASPGLEGSMRDFIERKIGPVLPPRQFWH